MHKIFWKFTTNGGQLNLDITCLKSLTCRLCLCAATSFPDPVNMSRNV